MKVTLVIAALFAVFSSSLGVDLLRANNLLREFRDFETFKQMQRKLGRCHREADVVFILDRSRSIPLEEFNKGKQFLVDVMKRFEPDLSRFAVVSFAEDATVDIRLQKINNHDVSMEINRIQQRPEIGGQTNTWLALEKAYNEVLSPRNRRSGVEPTVLLLTDGQSHNPRLTAQVASNAPQDITMFAIGVGSQISQTELQDIAPGHVHMVKNYSEALNEINDQVATEMCHPVRVYY